MAGDLGKIKHLVVLMMENRSFDHMLGYLSANEVLADVDGLDRGVHGNPRPDGEMHYVQPMNNRYLHHKVQDPGHNAADVKEQLAGGMQGFLRNYAKVLERNKRNWVKKDRGPLPPDKELWEDIVLAYQEAHEVPVYDWIARNFVICDRWFSSVAGPTWPNRMYAMTGGTAEHEDFGMPDWVPGFMRKKVREAPIYKGKAFPRWLRQDQWRWYSHDPATLRAADSAFRPGGERNTFATDENFAYFNRNTLFEGTTFIEDAARGRLVEGVSWIDPNFVDVRVLGPPGSNDDHPPSRVILGQELVLTILLALAESPCWKDTMLLITYDEHGGFYDHVDPKDYPCAGDSTARYGVRVPALVVSPYAQQTVSHTVFDHTSIPKTILTRFADAASRESAFKTMGKRTRAANDLSELVPLEEPREAPVKDLRALAKNFVKWKSEVYAGQYKEDPTLGERTFEFVSDLQAETMVQAAALREGGLPPGKP